MEEDAVIFYLGAGCDTLSQKIELYVFTPVDAMCFLRNFAPRRIRQAFLCSDLRKNSHSYILNFLTSRYIIAQNQLILIMKSCCIISFRN